MTEERAPEFASLVVVGASAGGIDALSRVLHPLQPSFPAPIVVAQHVQPTRESHLEEILAGRTSLKVVTVGDPAPLRPGTVYLVAADHHIVITDHVVEARPAEGTRPSPSIDRLLASAAEVFGERLIAVVLSGMGSDGVAGAAEVKARGGTVIIQNPETAAEPALPLALPPTIVDFAANAEQMGELLGELTQVPPANQPEDDERLLAQFLERVRQRTGIDFSAYKRPTIMRRLQRRMVATASASLSDYVGYVQRHPEEFQRLSSAFLIKVTQFFRDADLFEHIATTLLPPLIAEARERDRTLRIWSAGCATGEEAYSLAVLVAAALGDELEEFTVRIFATDLDDEAISFARRGRYPAASLSEVPPALKRRFVRDGDRYEVPKEIRSLVVFGQHDLGQRAPFPRIDLALCRNVLIYFTPELQKRALQLFAFSLREGAYLILGKAESTTPYAGHFILEQPRLKVYRRAGDRVLIPPARIRDTAPLPQPRTPTRREPAWATMPHAARPRGSRPSGDRGDEVLLRLPVGVVVIDGDYDISYINSEARRLLGIHAAAIGSDFVRLADRLPSDELRAAVSEAISGGSRVVTRPLPIQNDEAGQTTHVQLTLHPFAQSGRGDVNAVLITVVDVSEMVRERADMGVELDRAREDEATLTARLDRVARSYRDLLQANEEMTNANAVLRIANEELLVANEEVQASTEEVETLNEELQATNEELETLNEELQATVEELNTTNDDLEARTTELAEAAATLAEQRHRSELEREQLSLILDGMTEAVLVVDGDRRTVRTNRAYDSLFGTGAALVPQDAAGVDLAPEEWPQARAARGDVFSMSFTRPDPGTAARRWYEASGRGMAGSIGGGVIVIRDITDRSLRHLQERFIDAASHELQTPLAALHTYLQLAARQLASSGDGTDRDGAARRSLDRAIDQSRLLSDLASRLFDRSLIRHGRTVVRREPVDLRAVTLAAVDEVRSATPGARVAVRPGRSRAMVLGDDLRLRQMLSNVIRNAATHGASADAVDVDLSSSEDAVTVRVADRGPGISAPVRMHLFTPFVPSDGEPASGLGLGVYLAHEIAAEHGGTLSIEAREGGGTEAVILLPAAPRVRRPRSAPRRDRNEVAR